jgi:streptogramin lyase
MSPNAEKACGIPRAQPEGSLWTAEVKENLITNFPQYRGIAVVIEYFNKTQNNRHCENCKHFNSLRFDYN